MCDFIGIWAFGLKYEYVFEHMKNETSRKFMNIF